MLRMRNRRSIPLRTHEAGSPGKMLSADEPRPVYSGYRVQVRPPKVLPA